MSDNRFAVVFGGVIVPGANREQVKLNLAKLFKVEPARVEPMFSGKKVVIKAKLDQATAQKYQAALKNAGAICEVIDLVAAQAAAKASSVAAAPAKTAVAQGGAKPQPTAPTAVKPAGTAPVAPQWQVDQPGVVLVAPKEVKPLEVDLSALSMAEAGVVLVEHQEKRPPAIDTAHLSVAEAGGDLTAPREVAELQVDLSALSMAEPGVTLVQPKPVEELQIDTSNLSLG